MNFSCEMSVDKFGRYQHHRGVGVSLRGPRGQGFKLTESGDYDMEHRRLRNVGNADLTKDDAVSFGLLKAQGLNLSEELKKNYNELKSYCDQMDAALRTFSKDEAGRVMIDCQVRHKELLIKTEEYRKILTERMKYVEMVVKKYIDDLMQQHKEIAVKEAESAYNTIEPILNQFFDFQKNFETNVVNILKKYTANHPVYFEPTTTTSTTTKTTTPPQSPHTNQSVG